MQEKFKLTEKRYNLRRNAIYENRPFCTQKHSIESSVSIALKIWLLVCSHIKKIFMLIFLKNKVKNWLTPECPCKLGKRYIAKCGYL